MLTVGSFQRDFLYAVTFFVLATLFLLVAVQPCIEWIPIKKYFDTTYPPNMLVNVTCIHSKLPESENMFREHEGLFN